MKLNLPISKIVAVVFLICGFYTDADSQNIANDVYQTQVIAEKDLARKPVDRLKEKIDHQKLHLIKQEFITKMVYENFANRFGLIADHKVVPGCFKKPVLEIVVGPPIKIGTGVNGDHQIDMIIHETHDPSNSIIATLTTTFDVTTKEFLISDVAIVGQIPGLDCPPILPPPIPPSPDFIQSKCETDAASTFTYIKLRSRETSSDPVEDGQILGDNPSGGLIVIPDDFHQAIAFRQIPFQAFQYSTTITVDQVIQNQIINPLYEACLLLFNDYICGVAKAIAEFILQSTIVQVSVNNTLTYNAGYVISGKDASENEMADLFQEVFDADGVLEVVNSSGGLVSRSVGFFLDRKSRQIIALSSNNETLKYGLGSSHYHFNDPIAITAVGRFLYILDRGVTNPIVVLQYSLDSSGNLVWSLVGTTNFGFDPSFATDITSFGNVSENLLYIANPSEGTLTLVTLDKATGMPKIGAPAPVVFSEIVDADGEVMDLGSVTKIESSPRNSTNGRNTILATIGQDKVTVLSHDALLPNAEISANFRYQFPTGAGLRNIGYNQGNNAFYVTDELNHKVHIFSHDGEYIASGGQEGGAETQNDFTRPSTISSNTFVSGTNEMVIGGRWGSRTGFKKIKPLADISNICIVEKAPISIGDLEFNSLDLQFSLTDGVGVDQIVLEINGQVVKTLLPSNTTFRAGNYSNHFTVNSPNAGLLEELVVGWNTYTVLMDAHLDVGTSTIDYQRSVTREYYHIPSSFDQNFVVGYTGSPDLLHNNTDDPFVIYKNVWISGLLDGPAIDFTIEDGLTQILKGCILTVSKPTTFLVENEEIQFSCGANLQLIMEDGTAKLLKNTTFNGTFEADRMVMSYGDFTGNTGNNSANTSELEFINCDFINYYGTAYHLAQGRATLAEVTFQPGPSQSFSSTGILVSPQARLDMFGGGGFENDIAIDAVMADLFIGTNVGNYKGTSLSSTGFNLNKIAINSIATDCAVKKAVFEQNDACIMHLSGTLDLDQQSQNRFENNSQGIIFSDNLSMSGGKNEFINNNVDITYIMPLPMSQSSPVGFDVECNFWQHGSIFDEPVFDIKSDPPPYNSGSGLVEFDYTPYLEYVMGGATLACTGGQGGGGGGKKLGFVPSSFHTQSKIVSDDLESLNYSTAYSDLLAILEDKKYNIRMPLYPSKYDTVLSYQESLYKGLAFGYVSKMNLTGGSNKVLAYGNEVMKKLYPGSENNVLYEQVRRDRLEFLKFFINESGSKYSQPNENSADQFSDQFLATIEVYPNPITNSDSKIEIHVREASTYSMVIYNSVGQRIAEVFDNRKLNEGLNTFNLSNADLETGIIFLQLLDHGNSKMVNKKLVVIN